MAAHVPKQRTRTAADLAAQYDRTPRSIRSYAAEPRDTYLARTRTRREFVLVLREAGYTYKQIAEKEGITIGAVRGLLYRARRS